MKKMLRFLPVSLLFFMCSCSMREELEIKADGSGKLSLNNDMSPLIEMAKSMDQDGKITKDSNFTKRIDSTIYLKTFIDTAKKISAEKKALLRDGKMHLLVHGTEGLLKFNIEVPYKNSAQLQSLYTNVYGNSSSFFGAFDGLKGKSNMDLPSASEVGDKIGGLTGIGAIYDITIKDGVYLRKVNKERFEKYKAENNSGSDEIKGMSQMFGAMDYTIAIKFPRPVKKVNNKKAELSTDKLNVLLKGDVMDMMENPQNMELEVEF